MVAEIGIRSCRGNWDRERWRRLGSGMVVGIRIGNGNDPGFGNQLAQDQGFGHSLAQDQGFGHNQHRIQGLRTRFRADVGVCILATAASELLQKQLKFIFV